MLLTLFYNRSLKNKSHISDTSHFINFIENTPLPDGAVLATLDVCSLYTKIPQGEGIEVVGQHYQEHYQSKTPISTQSLGDLMRLILKENSFKFNDKHYLKTHGIAMGTKMAVAFAVIFLWRTLKNSYPPSAHTNLSSRRDLSLTSSECGPYPKQKSTTLLNSPTHSTPQLNSRIDVIGRVVFRDSEVFKGPRFITDKNLDVQTHFKPTETFQYIHFSSCHPLSVKKGFVKGEALRLLRTNSVKESVELKKLAFLTRLLERGYPKSFEAAASSSVEMATVNCARDITIKV